METGHPSVLGSMLVFVGLQVLYVFSHVSQRPKWLQVGPFEDGVGLTYGSDRIALVRTCGGDGG